ncbi:hypothetical protein [Microbacterium rhizomatis]|uniref:Tc toxin complex TcA C-terminal TcB-binding domain-containing protein n=1 Tax=Microbacterium rhizomatis TaxID=1631477 RepID=A0A5J5IZZ2_9MICO|nr:hypothetical protein [Microbacterium rhizomatis]KAA9105501.1 hypothetical protein F6B43_17135 [Microbacterium rhizomatis]
MPVYTSPYIRDEIIVTKEIEDICRTYAGDGPVFLLARKVTLAKELRITERPLVIVTDLFDGAGFTIYARGKDARASGTNGLDGVPLPMSQMYSHDGRPLAPGSDGQSGTAGSPGDDGGSVTIYARRTVNAQISVAGGNATSGGRGGNGTAGGNGSYTAEHTEQRDLTPNDPFDFEYEDVLVPEMTIDGTPGGNGGYGAPGGSGGNGGTIVFTSITDDTEPVFTTAPGAPGGGGAGGAAGADGAYSPSAASPGQDGAPGNWGAEGSVTRSTVSEDDFIAGLRPLLDSTGSSWANYWAPFRIAMGEYYYHRYNPSSEDPTENGELAATEIARGLELQPDNGFGLRLQAQLVGVSQDVAGQRIWVGGGTNVLGLSPELDIWPDFDTYIQAYQGFSTLATGFLLHGIDTIFSSGTTADLAALVVSQQQAADAARRNFDNDAELAASEKSIATDEASLVQQQLDEASADLQAAMAKMKETSFGFGDLIGTVASVAGAVVGVIAAIPTGGASLVALVPAMVSLVDTVTAQAEPLAKALLAGTKADTKAVEDAYKKVGKQADAVIAAGKTIVNFIGVVEKLTASSTPDNSEQVALVRRGAELAHQLLIANNRVALAQQRIDAAQARSARAAELASQAGTLADKLQVDAESVRQAGLLAISIAQSSAEALNSMAFRAARSVEILTLQPQAGNIALDAGVLSAETWLKYQEHDLSDIDLATALTASWGQMMKPLSIQQDYLAYFQRDHDQDVLSRIFEPGDREFEQLRATGRFDFFVDAAKIPAGRADAKIRSVRLALVGAAHPSGAISCEIRHGGRYEQRRADGTIDVQLLQARTSTRRAVLTPLSPEEPDSVDLPLTAPLSLAFWGRGVGGDWSVSVVGARENAGLDLSGLSQIQVEIRYQFLR